MDANSNIDLSGGGASDWIPTAGGGGGGGGGGNFPPPRGHMQSEKIMLSAIVVLVAVVIVVLSLHLYLRWRLRRLASLHRRTRSLVFALAPVVAARGIDADTLNSLPVISYTAAEAGEGAVECAVCISELEAGEKVRVLPRCGHRFHIECIDMWFHSHATCPLCRSAVEPMENPAPIRAAPPPVSIQPLNLIGSSSEGSSVPELRIEVPSRRGGEEDLGTASPSGFKSPSRCVRAIRRLLSRDSRLCRDGGSPAETDLEIGEGAEQPPAPSPRTQQV